MIRSDATLGLDELKFELFDARDGLVILEEIGMTLPMHPHTTQLGARPPAHQHGRGPRQGDQRGRYNRRDRDNRREQPPSGPPPESDREDVDEDLISRSGRLRK